MDFVHTTHGDLPRADLTYTDHTSEDATAVYTAREWFYRGEMVRRDAWVDLKRGHSSEVIKGN